MRTAVISDIHGNLDTLKNTIDDIFQQKCNRIVCLGDVVGYGYAPNECLEIIDNVCGKGSNGWQILGNHDAAVVQKLPLRWFNEVAAIGIVRDREKITDKNKNRISHYELQVIERPINQAEKPTVVFAHGDLDGGLEFPYIENKIDAQFVFRRMKKQKIDVLFVGHTHCALCFKNDNVVSVAKDSKENVVVQIGDSPIIVNVGSVGYPRNQPYSIYAIYDDEKGEIVWRVLPFDFKRYCKRLKENNIPCPDWMKRWIRMGILSKDDAFVKG